MTNVARAYYVCRVVVNRCNVHYVAPAEKTCDYYHAGNFETIIYYIVVWCGFEKYIFHT